MATAARKFVTISGLSDEVRIPRLGRIRLGHINVNNASGNTYPIEDPFFHVPPEVQEVYGEHPTELDIMFPVNDRGVVFPQAYEYYGSARRLLCTGNGKEAMRWNKDALVSQPCGCPCDLLGKGCKQRGHLMVMLPKVKNQGGVYQVDTGSINAIIAINSTLNILAPEDNPDSGMLGYFAMVPMKLRRVARDIYPNGMHKKSYPLQLSLNANEDEIKDLRARRDEILAKTRCWVVEQPEQTTPEDDPGMIITIDDKPLERTSTTADTPLVSVQSNLARESTQQTSEQIPETSLTSSSAPLQALQAAEEPKPTPNETRTEIAHPTNAQPQPTAQAPKNPTPPANQAFPRHSRPTLSSSTEAPAPAQGQPTRTAVPTARESVTPLSMTLTRPQQDRILAKTRGINIPDDIVRQKTATLTKKEASGLIDRLDRGDFSFFEKREVKAVPLPQSA